MQLRQLRPAYDPAEDPLREPQQRLQHVEWPVSDAVPVKDTWTDARSPPEVNAAGNNPLKNGRKTGGSSGRPCACKPPVVPMSRSILASGIYASTRRTIAGSISVQPARKHGEL